MYLIQITVETRIIIGIAAMVVLMVGFIVAFVFIQQKKLEYQKNMQAVLEQRQQLLAEQNEMLEIKVNDRTAELKNQKEALQASLAELKATQQQLVQSEKMASLGEMTAGIAHEMQNPLNFINNFSEVSVELLEEMETELAKGKVEAAVAVGNEIKENLRIINNHGRKADKIVKGMLEHTKTLGGKKEFTDINQLLKETLKVCLSSLKSKWPDAEIHINFEENKVLQPVALFPQELSRVISNIINNAFYYTLKKKKESSEEGYVPVLQISAEKENNEVVISIKDNGSGIPDLLLPKIFQPFFTTKPAGDGTGLGLSLSYDIITKTHGGKLTVESVENEWTNFIISLPMS
jgi:signal transduction histidine kinase